VPIAEPYEPYLTAKPAAKIALTGKYRYMSFSYKDNPLRNEEPHYFNLYFANAFWGFQHIAHQERYSEREYAANPMGSRTKYDFICGGGRSNHWNPSDHNRGWRFYTKATGGKFKNEIYGEGMITAARSASAFFIAQDYSRMDPV
jgi:hypothetical protein